MSKYTESDAAKDTGVSERDVAGAWHAARDDHSGRGGGSRCFVRDLLEGSRGQRASRGR